MTEFPTQPETVDVQKLLAKVIIFAEQFSRSELWMGVNGFLKKIQREQKNITHEQLIQELYKLSPEIVFAIYKEFPELGAYNELEQKKTQAKRYLSLWVERTHKKYQEQSILFHVHLPYYCTQIETAASIKEVDKIREVIFYRLKQGFEWLIHLETSEPHF